MPLDLGKFIWDLIQRVRDVVFWIAATHVSVVIYKRYTDMTCK